MTSTVRCRVFKGSLSGIHRAVEEGASHKPGTRDGRGGSKATQGREQLRKQLLPVRRQRGFDVASNPLSGKRKVWFQDAEGREQSRLVGALQPDGNLKPGVYRSHTVPLTSDVVLEGRV